MKLLMENWRRYLNEEALEESPLSALALALGLGAAPAAADDEPKKEPTHQVDTQQAQDEESEIGYSQDAEWHKFGVQVDKDMFEMDPNSAAEMAKMDALAGLIDNGVDVNKGYRIIKSGLGFEPGVVVVGVMK
jgi:hypothetical protein